MEQFKGITLISPHDCDAELIALLEPISSKIVYPGKVTFTKPGDDMDSIFYIKRGRTKHYIYGVDGSVKILYFLEAGWFFGETPYFLHKQTGLYSVTEEETVLYKIPADQCRRLLAESELFRNRLFHCTSHKMLTLRYEIENLTFNSCKTRLQRLFCTLVDQDAIVDQDWYCLKVRMTHSELGEIVGGARVTVSRLINELCNEGFIRVINRRAQVNIAQYNQFMLQNAEE